MELVVKVIGKDIKTDKVNFTAYSLLTAKGNWFRTAKIKPEELKPYQGEIVVATITRKFDKKVRSAFEEDMSFPTLVVESLREPTDEERKKYEEELQKLNNETLVGVE